MAITLKMREEILLRDNYICRACGFGGSVNYVPFLDCDHIVPRSKGGEDSVINLQCLCKACNGAKGNRFSRHFAVRTSSATEKVWAHNQKIVAYAFSANSESDLAMRFRKLK